VSLRSGDVLTTKYITDVGPVPTGLVRFADAEGAAAATEALQGKKMVGWLHSLPGGVRFVTWTLLSVIN
jgi:hypothetical protein